MGYITKFGTIWGQIPVGAGNVYWVAPAASYTVEGRSYTASDNNDGLSPERALLTLGQAITNATASAGDVIVLLPGAHSWSASAAMSKAGITVMGLPSGQGNPVQHKTSITTTADDEIINVTAANCEIAYLHVIPVTTRAGIDANANADQLYVHHCSFDLETAVANTGTKGLACIGASPDRIVVEDCSFFSDGAQGAGVSLSGSTKFTVRRNWFMITSGTWATAIDLLDAAHGIIDSNRFLNFLNGVLTKAITGADLVTTNSVAIMYNLFTPGATTGRIDDFGATDAYLAENYLMGAGGGAGGSIIATIT